MFSVKQRHRFLPFSLNNVILQGNASHYIPNGTKGIVFRHNTEAIMGCKEITNEVFTRPGPSLQIYFTLKEMNTETPSPVFT